MNPKSAKLLFTVIFVVVFLLSIPLVSSLSDQLVEATGEEYLKYLVLLIIFGPAFGVFAWFLVGQKEE